MMGYGSGSSTKGIPVFTVTFSYVRDISSNNRIKLKELPLGECTEFTGSYQPDLRTLNNKSYRNKWMDKWFEVFY